MKFAGFWRRLIAIIIDESIVSIPAYLVGGAFAYAFGWNTPTAAAVAMVLLAALYFIILEGRWGTTIGKRLMNLKIVIRDLPNQDGIGYGRAFLRAVVGLAINAAANLNFLSLLVDAERRTFADRAFGTIVIHDPAGKFQLIDPDKFPRAGKRVFWVVVLLLLSLSPFAFAVLLPAPK